MASPVCAAVAAHLSAWRPRGGVGGSEVGIKEMAAEAATSGGARAAGQPAALAPPADTLASVFDRTARVASDSLRIKNYKFFIHHMLRVTCFLTL